MLFSGMAFARDAYMRGYVNRDGTYGDPYYRAMPNDTRNDKSSAKGNANPYAGQQGKKNPDPYDPKYNNQYNRPRY